MVDRIACPVSGKRILLFGPQALSFGEDSFHQTRSTLLETEDYRWILETIAELPQWLRTFSREYPRFRTEPGLKLLEDLNECLKHGGLLQAPASFPNILLNPLVIITHLIQFSKYLRLANPRCECDDDLYSAIRYSSETLGFCTGLLSALAVSLSASQDEFQKYGAVALRIGMIIGMTVDAQDANIDTGEASSFATVWNSVEAKEEMTRIMKNFPEVNLSLLNL